MQAKEIIPLLYDEDYTQWEYNNFIYRVNLTKPITSFTSAQPLTVKPAEGASSVVLRLSNPIASGVNNTNRIENEVASVHFARTALAKLPKHSEIVPAVYSWGELKTGTTPPEKGFGWIMMEARPGVQLDEQFKTWSLDDRKVIVEEMAQILTAIQTQPLPAKVGSFGGLTIKDGQIVSGQPTVIAGGPWRTYEEFWTALLNMELSQSEESHTLNGWRANGVRERVDKFIGRAVRDLLADVDRNQRVFCHGDFCEYSKQSCGLD
jgi:hypothetical protein